MTSVIRKIDLPDEITIEQDGAKFIFGRPSQLDLFDYEFGKPKGLLQYAIAKLTRIEEMTFEDGTPYGVAQFVDLPLGFLNRIAFKYLEAITPYFSQEAGAKKAPEENASSDSSNPA